MRRRQVLAGSAVVGQSADLVGWLAGDPPPDLALGCPPRLAIRRRARRFRRRLGALADVPAAHGLRVHALIAFLPFVIMALTMSLGAVYGPARATERRRITGTVLVLVFLVAVIGVT